MEHEVIMPSEPGDEPAEMQHSQQVDYFGVDVEETVTLPDGKSYVVVKLLTEGDRRKYLNKMNRDIRLERETGDAHLKMATGDERYNLLDLAIVGWNLVRKNTRTGEIEPLPFNPKNKREFLEGVNPSVLDVVEKKVRDMNAWLTPVEATIEAIDEQIEELQKQRDKLVEKQEGNSD